LFDITGALKTIGLTENGDDLLLGHAFWTDPICSPVTHPASIAPNARHGRDRRTPHRRIRDRAYSSLGLLFAAETISALLVMQPREERMVTDPRRGIRSTASIGGHPIHPMLVPFPIAFLIGTLGTDLVFWGTGDAFWARASAWLVGAGIVMGLLAAVFGFIDFVTIERARTGSTGWVHAPGNLLAVVLSFVSLLLRIGDAKAGVLPGGLVLSVIVVAILLVTGWMGGELAYRYKIGVIEDGGA
jgi:uncharacterized membrane protein